MIVELTEKQLSHISSLIEAKGVNFYDVNIEMTDHVATKVEELMENEKLVFTDAVNKVFSGYSRFHFMHIEDEKIKLLQKRSWLEMRNEMLLYFTFPNLIFTIFSFLVAFALIRVVDFYYILAFIGIISFILIARLYWIKHKLLGSKKYLQLNNYHGYNFLTMYINYFTFHINNQYVQEFSNSQSLIVPQVIQALVISLVLFLLNNSISLYSNQIYKIKREYAT